jgi:hypothetical protein
MATRKTKRYSDGGDVLERMMGTSSNSEDGPGRDTNGPEPMMQSGNGDAEMMEQLARGLIRGSKDDEIGPRDTGYMDEPIKRVRPMPMPRPPMRDPEEGGGIPAMQGIPATEKGGGIKPFSGNQSGPANMAAMMGQVQKAGGLEGMAGALRGAMASIPERGRNMGNRMGGMAKGGSVSSASSRGDGIAQRGKTRGQMR